MDKDILAVIGRLYLDSVSMSAYIENLKNRVSELENKLAQQSYSVDDNTKE